MTLLFDNGSSVSIKAYREGSRAASVVIGSCGSNARTASHTLTIAEARSLATAIIEAAKTAEKYERGK